MSYPPVTLNMISRGDGTMASYDVGRLSAPVGLSTGNASSGSITLTWEYEDQDQTGFVIEKSTDGVTWAEASRPGATSRSRYISGLQAETTYLFRIKAVDSKSPVRDSDWSNVATGTTTEAGQVPGQFVQLSHFPPAEQPLEIYYPRPDAETNTWARHRKNHPDVPFEIPIIAAWGSPPYFYELLEAPDGMTLGAFLPKTPEGKYDWEDPNNESGILRWSTPTATGMPGSGWLIRVRVTDQNLDTAEVEWRLVVTADGIIFVDAVNGDNANPGTIDQPLKNTRGWYKDDNEDTTYSGYQVIYRSGEHDLYFSPGGLNDGGGVWYGKAKPLVHYGFPGESVVWSHGVSRIILDAKTTPGAPDETKNGGSDLFFGNIAMSGFEQQYYREGEPGHTRAFYQHGGHCTSEEGYGPDGNGCRITFYKVSVSGLNEGYTSDDNAGFFFGHRPDRNGWNSTTGVYSANDQFRRYICGSRVTCADSLYSGERWGTTGGVNWQFFYLGATEKSAFEYCFSDNTDMTFPYASKAGNSYTCMTYVRSMEAVRVRQNFGTSYRLPIGGQIGFESWRYWKSDVVVDPDLRFAKYNLLTNDGVSWQQEPYTTDRNLEYGPVYFDRITLVNRNNGGRSADVRVSESTFMRNAIFASPAAPPMLNPSADQPANYGDADWARLFQVGVDTVPLDENLDLTTEGENLRGEFGAEIWEEVV